MNKHFVAADLPEWLVAGGRAAHFRQGAFIFHQHDLLDQIYVVRRGTVIILCVDPKGHERKVVLVPEGGTVGEMEAIVGSDRVVYSAKAFTDCDLLVLSTGDFLRWIDEDAHACRRLATVLAHKLYAASSQSAQYTSLDATTRLASVLTQMEPGLVGYTREELAEACSVSLRTVNRGIKKLQEMGALSRQRGKIIISERQHDLLDAYIRQKEDET